MKKTILILLVFILAVSVLATQNHASAGAAVWRVDASPVKIDSRLSASLSQLQQGETITVIVTLQQQADLSRLRRSNRAARLKAVIQALQSTSNATQGPLTKLLTSKKDHGRVKRFEPLWVFNGFSVTATSDVIDELSRHPDVSSISSDDLQIVPAAYSSPEPNISLVNAPALWSQGFSGQGIVVANMDTGVDSNHPDLSARWRGGGNSWFDPYGQHPVTPADLNGHGTWTMGVMVGGQAGGTTVGVAPDAQWIAVKIFNDAGSSTATAIHQGFQWLLNPDGNLNTADAPQVVNNSWTYSSTGCYLDFELDLQSLRAAGILPIFAAGNGGPYTNTSYSPANNPSAFAVGAINNSSQIYGYSSRGPTTCGGSSGPYPEIVAPGVNVNTTDLYNSYYTATGTSLAAPHVAGGLALLLSAHPDLAAADQERALINSAVDLGASGPDDVYGYGRLDLLSAFNWLAVNPTATAAITDTPPSLPTDTATPLPTDTPTDTATPLPTNMPTATFTFTPTATATFTPSPTNTSAPTFTFTLSPTPSNPMHIGDLDRATSKPTSTTWKVIITIKLHNSVEKPLASATVTGQWSNGASGTVTCVTNSSGVCKVTKTGLSYSVTSRVTFTVTNVTLAPYAYQPGLNHDPDGDSNGTMIVVPRP